VIDGDLHPDRSEELKKRVVSAAEAALAHQQYVSAIGILTRTGLLAPTDVESWRKGRINFLEHAIQANLKKISQSMAMFRDWALERGLKPLFPLRQGGGNIAGEWGEPQRGGIWTRPRLRQR
jgi:hypothetical protein